MLTDFSQLPTLVGQCIQLRWMNDADVPALYDIFSHADVAQYWSRPVMTDRSEAVDLLRSIRECFDSRTLLQWGIERLDEEGVIGTCTLASLDPENRRAEIGFALNRSSWGRGYVSDALTTVLGFAFESLDLHRIEADVDPRNDRSIRVLERQGFRREGFLRERWIVGGVILDTALFGLLRREWTGRANRNSQSIETTQANTSKDASS